jgi:hypothetical protein
MRLCLWKTESIESDADAKRWGWYKADYELKPNYLGLSNAERPD